jgi:quercetin dioxygenase-like cupin family protein
MLIGQSALQSTETVADGVTRRQLSTGERIQVFELEMKGGTPVPEHSHSNEQAGYVVRGRFEVDIGGEQAVLEAGHFFRIPANVPHSGFVHEDTLLIDIYSPPRD